MSHTIGMDLDRIKTLEIDPYIFACVRLCGKIGRRSDTDLKQEEKGPRFGSWDRPDILPVWTARSGLWQKLSYSLWLWQNAYSSLGKTLTWKWWSKLSSTIPTDFVNLCCSCSDPKVAAIKAARKQICLILLTSECFYGPRGQDSTLDWSRRILRGGSRNLVQGFRPENHKLSPGLLVPFRFDPGFSRADPVHPVSARLNQTSKVAALDLQDS